MTDDELVRDLHRRALALVAAGASDVDLDALVDDHHPLLPAVRRQRMLGALRSLMGGLGVLDDLLADDSVSDVFVNGPGEVWVERGGTVEPSGLWLDAAELEILIERVVAPLGRRVDRAAPFADARLASGYRVHVAVPPVAVDGPYVTIRRFRTRPVELADFGAEHVGRLAAAVADRANILVSGGTGAGKTTLLNALASVLPRSERVVTIEDAAELSLDLAHVVRLEARPANAEAVGEVPIRELVRQALRMRPDRIVLGEVRGAEAFDMLQAMNTGHDGSMTTCHANGPSEAILRVVSLAQQAGVRLDDATVRSHVLSTIDLVAHVARGRDGQRRVVAVARPEELS